MIITIGIIIVLLIIMNFVAQDMAIRITAIKYNEDPKELRKKFKQWRKEKKRK